MTSIVVGDVDAMVFYPRELVIDKIRTKFPAYAVRDNWVLGPNGVKVRSVTHGNLNILTRTHEFGIEFLRKLYGVEDRGTLGITEAGITIGELDYEARCKRAFPTRRVWVSDVVKLKYNVPDCPADRRYHIRETDSLGHLRLLGQDSWYSDSLFTVDKFHWEARYSALMDITVSSPLGPVFVNCAASGRTESSPLCATEKLINPPKFEVGQNVKRNATEQCCKITERVLDGSCVWRYRVAGQDKLFWGSAFTAIH